MKHIKQISKALLIAAIGMSLGGEQLIAMGRRERGQHRQQPAPAPRRQPAPVQPRRNRVVNRFANQRRQNQQAAQRRRQQIEAQRRQNEQTAARRRQQQRERAAVQRNVVRNNRNNNNNQLLTQANQLLGAARGQRGVHVDATANNVVFIQLPGHGQGPGKCGIHAMINAGILGRNDDLDNCRILLSQSQGTIRRIRNNYQRGTNVDNGLLSRWNGGDNSFIDTGVLRSIYSSFQANYFLNQFEAQLQNIDNRRVNLTLNGHNFPLQDLQRRRNRTISSIEIAHGLNVVRNARDPRWRLRNTYDRQVFVFNTGGHWIAVRLQRLHGGRTAVIFVDTNSANRIGAYRARLMGLVREIRGY